jgi:hypothetical protein
MPIMPPGHVLVAAAHDHHAVHPLALHAGLDAVGDHLAADQRVLHALGAHRHAVGDGGRAEDLRVAAGFLDAAHGGVGQLLQPLLQGVMVLWPLATPTIGLPKSVSL